MNVSELAIALITFIHVQMGSLSFINVHLVILLILFMEFVVPNVTFAVAAKLMIGQVHLRVILVKLSLFDLVGILI